MVGEVWRVGGVLLQVTQPRVPCWKPAALGGERRLTGWMRLSGFTGYLLRVVRGGGLEVGAAVEVVERPATGVSVMELNRLRYRDRSDVRGLERALAVTALPPEWRAALQRRLARAGG